MFPTNFEGDTYEVIAWANHERVLYHQRFGDYQGEWLIVSLSEGEGYKIYKGSYGSCSGCDSYEGFFDYSSDVTIDKAKEFAKDYKPFMIVPRDTMRKILSDGVLRTILPANRRDQWEDEIDFDNVAKDLSLLFKLEENLEFNVKEIIDAPNAESKQRALKQYGYERFVAETNMQVVAVDGENQLMKTGDIVFVYVKDASTDRRYLLRVPPNTTRVREAIAWTFNMSESEYTPLVET